MKKLIYILSISGLIFSATLITSCEKTYLVPIEPPADVSYANDVQPFFDAKCIGCHTSGGSLLDLTSNVSYDNLINGTGNSGIVFIDIADPPNSDLYLKINVGGSMEGFTNSSDRTMVLKWIEQGAKDN